MIAIESFIVYLIISIVISVYGIFMHKNTNESKDIDKICIDLGIFTFLSGVWILTDSRALEISPTATTGYLREILLFSYPLFLLC